MKKLLLLALVVFAAWQAWKHYPTLFHRPQSHEAVVVNRSERTMVRIRLSVGGQTFVKERLQDGESARFPFRVASDATFKLEWEWDDAMGDQHWSGGFVPRGPMIQRHTFAVDHEGGVVYQAENILGVAP